MTEVKTYTDELLEIELYKIVEDLKAKHIELGQKATGKWVESLEVIVDDGKGVIYGTDYTTHIVHGRPSGARPPIAPLEEWVQAKLGLQGKEALNVAFAVATKIAKEGTETHKIGGSDLIESVITDNRIKQMYKNIGKGLRVKIAENLKRRQ